MFQNPASKFYVSTDCQPVVRVIGLTVENVWTRKDIVAWRKLDDRENCYLDTEVDGLKVRFHIKRYKPARGFRTPAEDDVKGMQALMFEKIPTAKLICYGVMNDRRSFIVTQDLTGYTPGDKWVEAGGNFGDILVPTADLAAQLHKAGLHHRDLYLCHFMIKPSADRLTAPGMALIDTARVGRLGSTWFSGRWIIKDLAQFWYSTTKLPITDEQREAWLKRYAEQRGLPGSGGLKPAVLSKAASIAKHDKSLNQKQPNRNVSIPNR